MRQGNARSIASLCSRRRCYEPARRILSQSRLPGKGRWGEGNIWIHARTPLRYRCTVCEKTFSARAATLFHRRQTDEATIALVVTLVANGCPIAAIVVAYGVQRQTVCAWLDAAGSQGEAIHHHFVCQPHDLGAVQADEIRVPQQGRVVWAARLLGVGTAKLRKGDDAAYDELRKIPPAIGIDLKTLK